MDLSAVTWKDRGNAFYRDKRFREALGCYAEAVRVDPAYADAWHNLGMTCRALGYEEEAQSCFSRELYYAAIKEGRGSVTLVHGEDPGRPSKKRTFPFLTSFRNKFTWKAGFVVLSVLFLVVLSAAFFVPLVSGPQPHAPGIPELPGAPSGINASNSPVISPGMVSSPVIPALNTMPSTTMTDPVPVKYQALKTGAVSRSFPYVLRGESGKIDIVVYKGVNDETSKEDPYCYTGKADRYQKFIDLPVQQPFLSPLVDAIRSKTSDPDDQVRIATSLVQNIPYDEAVLNSGSLEIRYPYQTLFDNKGVCCEKSVLLAYILRDLGYGTALLDFPVEQHTAVGIRVPLQYSYKSTGYAFIETTTPSIITDGNGNYPEFGRITSAPDVLPVASGKSFDSVREEWLDSVEWNRIDSLGPVLDKYDFHQWQILCKKYGIVPGS